MKVAIIFIGTSKYLNFLPAYYEGAESRLFPGVEKHYFVFSDGDLSDLPSNITVIPQEHLPFPYITLYRFDIINRAMDQLEEYDYLLFMDADTQVVNTVEFDEVFPKDKPLTGVHHPCHFLGMPPHDKPPGAFETRFESAAGIGPEDDTSVYFQGCLWGGKMPYVLGMIRELAQRTQFDLSRDVIAQWHDESQMNKFFCERREDVHVMGPEYAYPECFGAYCTFEPKIVHLAKDNSKYQQ